MTTRNYAIDALRAISVLYIVGYWHLFNYIPKFPGYLNPYSEGMAYVILGTFTFTSGYLLASRNMELGFTEVMSFYRRRLVRIYPLYVLALLLFLWNNLASKAVIINGALLISMFFPPAPPTLWFITMIMSFYLIAPVLIHSAARPPMFLAIFGALFVAFIGFSSVVNPVDQRIFMYFPAFALGIMLARNTGIRRAIQDVKILLLILLIPAFLLFKFSNVNSFPLGMGLTPLILIGTLCLFVYAEHYLNTWRHQAINYISYASFCMYLFHRIVYQQVKAVYFPTEPLLQIVYMLVIGLGITILLSYQIQLLYDRTLAAIDKTTTSWL